MNRQLRYCGLFFVLVLISPFHVRAQAPSSDSAPSVQIDTSVLDELNRHYGDDEDITPVQDPVLTAPSLKKDQERTVRPLLTVPEPPKAKNFPVQVKVRSETMAPGYMPPKTEEGAPASSEDDKPLEVTSTSSAPPLPLHKPIASGHAWMDHPPLPLSRPPEAVRKVSPAYAQALKRQALAALKQEKTSVPPAPSRATSKKITSSSLMAGRVDGPAMPALPKDPVEKKPLPQGQKRVVQPDKETFLQKVETVSAQIGEDAAPPSFDGGDIGDFKKITLPFLAGDASPTAEGFERIRKDILAPLRNNRAWRLQIKAFAMPDDKGASSARRLSLSRALGIREFLLANGVDAPRMDVRALGQETSYQPVDRVELILLPSK